MNFEITMVNPQKVILDELQMRGITQKSIALTYAFCIKQYAECDFEIINKAIIDKWGKKILVRIKNKAWKIVEGANK